MTIAPSRLTDDLAGQRQELSCLPQNPDQDPLKVLETVDAFILAHWALTCEGFLAPVSGPGRRGRSCSSARSFAKREKKRSKERGGALRIPLTPVARRRREERASRWIRSVPDLARSGSPPRLSPPLAWAAAVFSRSLTGRKSFMRSTLTGRPTCPQCGSVSVRRSHRRGIWERLVSAVLRYPFRCEDCHYRFSALRWGAGARRGKGGLQAEGVSGKEDA
jgi:hypothetical protein